MIQYFKIGKITLIFIFVINFSSIAQNKSPYYGEVVAPLSFDNDRENPVVPNLNLKQIAELEREILSAKQRGDINGVVRIQKDLDKLTGSVTRPGEKMDLKLIENEAGNDNINSGLVSQVTGVKGINTCTEQIGFTATRIWTAFVYGPNSGPTNDLLRVCYSDDGGRSWNEKATIGFSTGNRMWHDEIDIELIENTSGDKYLWIAFGYATNNYSGLYRVGVTIVKITGALSFNGYTLNWPTLGGLNYYYRPRIVSDNEAYRSNPWIYITCCYDSAVSGGYMSGEKVAIVFSPYTTLPTFTYKPTSFFGLAFTYPSDFHCDIAFFRNGGQDSILLVESSRGDSSRISIAKSSISTYVSSSTFVGTFNVTVARRYQAYIASNGAYNGLMIVNLRKYDATDWDIEFFRSTTGSIGSWSTGYVDFTGNNSTRADIQGFRSSPGTFSCAYASNDPTFPLVSYSYATNYNWGPVVYQMNHKSTNPFIAKPRPGVRYGPEEESCFAVWTEYSGGTNVWASVGCSGAVNSYKSIFFRGVIEGLWDAPADTMRNDTVTILLREDIAPYNIVDSSKVRLDNDGYGTFWFTGAQDLTNYYIVVKHRNSIETWSATTFQFNPVSYSYDFTFATFQAYGANMVQVDTSPDLFAFYSGDVNQDGVIDGSDLLLIDNDASNFVTGYVPTDINGDEFVDGSDAAISDNNASNFVIVIRPK